MDRFKKFIGMIFLTVSMVWATGVDAMQKQLVGTQKQRSKAIVAEQKSKVLKKRLTYAEQNILNRSLLHAKTAGQVRSLIVQKANVEARRYRDGMTALMLASYFCKDEVGFARVTALIECKSDVNQRDKQGNMALHWVADGGWNYPGIVPLLIKYNAGIDLFNGDGETALSKAEKVCPATAELLRQWGASSDVFYCERARVVNALDGFSLSS